MRINSQSKTPFNGILIKNATFEEVRDVAMFLKFRGYRPLGFKRLYLINGDIYEMGEKAREVRTVGLHGKPKEFGTLYFPWSNAAFLIASPGNEKKIYKEVLKMRPDAALNMLV